MSLHDIYQTLTIVSVSSTFIPLLCFFRIRRLSFELYLLLIYLIASVIVDLISIYLVKYLHQSNYYLFHAFVLFEAALLTALYVRKLGFKYWIWLILVVEVLFRISLFWVACPNGEIFVSLLINLSFVFFSLACFKIVLDHETKGEIMSSYFFWVNSGVLIYFGSTFLLAIFERTIRATDIAIEMELWSIQLVSNVIFHALLAIGIWKSRLISL
jgi:hypothetical protein